jgi:hypothetical protein
MLNLEEPAVTAWLAAIHPARQTADWPPAVRPIETQTGAPQLLAEIGHVLGGLNDTAVDALTTDLRTGEGATDLRDILAQTGAARLLRILHWLAELSIADTHLVVAALTEGDGPEARALRAAINAVTRRALIARIFAPDRIAVLQTITERAFAEPN